MWDQGGDKVFWVFSGKKIKRTAIAFCALFFAAALYYANTQQISVFSLEEEGPTAYYSVDTDEKLVALTFDISWGEEIVGPVLDALEATELDKATFFLSAPWAENHPDIVKRIVDSGYEIGSHGHKHDNYTEHDEDWIRQQITKAHQTLTELTDQEKLNLIRLPNGDFDKRVLEVVDSMGYHVIQWDTDSLDWMRKSADEMTKRVLNKAHPGDIILFHASDSAKNTPEALPRVIKGLREEGYRFTTVSELIAGSVVETDPVEDAKVE